MPPHPAHSPTGERGSQFKEHGGEIMHHPSPLRGEGRVRGHALLVTILVLLSIIISSIPSLAREVRVGVYQNRPKVFTGEGGESRGIFIDIIEEIARREGWNLEYVPGSWKEGLERLRGGEIDLMPDVSYLEERDRIFDYNRVPVLSDWFQVYRGSGSEIDSLLDLEGTRVGALSGSIQERVTSDLMADFSFETEIVGYREYGSMFRSLASGEIDAGITNRYYGSTLETMKGVEETGIVFHPNSLYFAVPGGRNDALLAAIDTHVGQMKGDRQSVYYQSLKRWLGEKPDLELPVFLVWTFVALVAGLLLFLGH